MAIYQRYNESAINISVRLDPVFTVNTTDYGRLPGACCHTVLSFKYLVDINMERGTVSGGGGKNKILEGETM